MKTIVLVDILILLAATASVFMKSPRRPQAPAKGGAGTAAQDHPRQTATPSGKGRPRKIPCKTSENASLCYWTHGRLSVYEGMVTYRIWKVGTRRLLGVFSGPSHYPARTDEDIENPEFPAELDRAYETDNRRHKKATGKMWTVPPPVFADFEVCPLRPEEKGVRQPVCIESAKNIFIETDY